MALKKIGAFWLRDAKSGVKYMSGLVNDEKVVMFKNNKKEEEKQPDYLLYTEDNEPKEEPKEPEIEVKDLPF